MGRRHQVDYPAVPQSHQQQEHGNNQYQPRFSWMDPPSDGDRKRYTQNVQMQMQIPVQPPSQSMPPPQPHASLHQQMPTQMRLHPSIPEVYTPPTLGPFILEPQQEGWDKQQEAEKERREHARSPPPPISAVSQLQSLPEKASSQYASDIKQPEKAINVGKGSNWTALAPDENPLSPPLSAKVTRPARQTTNMGVISPPNMTFSPASHQQASQPVRGGPWHHSLCSCVEPSICMTGLFCPCILYGRVQYRLGLRSEKKDATNMLGYKAVNGSCVAWTFLCGINGILSGLQKSRVRRAYEMDDGAGNCFSDCIEGCCCCCCVLAQNEKELKYREEEGRKIGGSQPVGYVPPSGMTFSSQR